MAVSYAKIYGGIRMSFLVGGRKIVITQYRKHLPKDMCWRILAQRHSICLGQSLQSDVSGLSMASVVSPFLGVSPTCRPDASKFINSRAKSLSGSCSNLLLAMF